MAMSACVLQVGSSRVLRGKGVEGKGPGSGSWGWEGGGVWG